MKTGDIVLIPFPFTTLNQVKLRPAVIVCNTKDQYSDIVICAISSVIPSSTSENEFILSPSKVNGLRRKSVVKVDRIFTLKSTNIRHRLGNLETAELQDFRIKFKALVD